MSLFDIILVQPIFNVLLFIYGLIPGHDFGIALILFTIVIRLVMWPLVKKQLHQTKVMQNLQVDIQKIKQRTKGNRQLEAKLMMELYSERGVNPFGSIGLLVLQLPIFIALFAVVRLVTTNHSANIAKYAYSFIEQLPYIKEISVHPDKFNHMLLGLVDLTKQAMGPQGVYIPLFIMSVAAAGFQYWQSKQLLPKTNDSRRLRDVLKEQANGKNVDQSEMSALMSKRMVYLFPLLTLFVSMYFAGALVLYFLTTSIVAVIQQSIVLRRDSDEMVELADKPPTKTVKDAKEAEVVSTPKKKKREKRT